MEAQYTINLDTGAPYKLTGNTKMLTGRKFNRLTVIELVGRRGVDFIWRCKCDCGTVKEVRGQNLKDGMSRSCGCIAREKLLALNAGRRTHGLTGTGVYQSYHAMKDRCLNPNHIAYARYGGRHPNPITICPEWLGANGLQQFHKDMGDRPEGKTLDRIDNQLGYSKANCEWRTKVEQARNRSTNVIIVLDGEFACATAWAEKLGVKAGTLLSALKSGLSLQEYIERHKDQPEFHSDGSYNIRNPEIRRQIADCVQALYEVAEPKVFSMGELATVIDLSSRQAYRLLTGVCTPTEPAAVKLAEFFKKMFADIRKRKHEAQLENKAA
jgi:hypothetical protein